MSDPFFKIRPSKRSNPEARTTLDTVHQHYLSKIKDVGEQITVWKDQQHVIQDKLNQETEEMQRYRFEQDIKEIQQKINHVDKKDAMFDYFLQTGDLLLQYYDIQDRINRGADNVISVADRARPGSVFEALENASRQDSSGTHLLPAPIAHPSYSQSSKSHGHKEETLGRDQLLDQYLQRMDPHYNRPSHALNDTSFQCDGCGEDMKVSVNDATISCP